MKTAKTIPAIKEAVEKRGINFSEVSILKLVNNRWEKLKDGEKATILITDDKVYLCRDLD